jgi:hypothetical protein
MKNVTAWMIIVMASGMVLPVPVTLFPLVVTLIRVPAKAFVSLERSYVLPSRKEIPGKGCGDNNVKAK